MASEKVFIEGVGWCYQITIDRYDKNGINEPHDIYEPI